MSSLFMGPLGIQKRGGERLLFVNRCRAGGTDRGCFGSVLACPGSVSACTVAAALLLAVLFHVVVERVGEAARKYQLNSFGYKTFSFFFFFFDFILPAAHSEEKGKK